MILGFRTQGTEDIFNQLTTSAARRTLLWHLWSIARRKLGYLNAAKALGDLRAPPANRLELLRGDRMGQYSIRINAQYRICFRWLDGDVVEVEIVDYH